MDKIIHYFWFGHHEKPELVQRCIASWKQQMPDWKIIEWNETNYDVNCIPYSKEAYEAHKYAFVSDYARCKVIYEYGGVYLDTDVELLKPLDDLVNRCQGFMGFELEETVNPGSILASDKGNALLGEICRAYQKASFIENGKLNLKTVVEFTTEILLLHGLNPNGTEQIIEGITIFPKEYFSPMDIYTEELIITEHTYSIHHYTATWQPWYRDLSGKIRSWCKRLIGPKWTRVFIDKKRGIKRFLKKV
ncbi:MAG: glycosyltransferase [Lachnospiraceae bacterium]